MLLQIFGISELPSEKLIFLKSFVHSIPVRRDVMGFPSDSQKFFRFKFNTGKIIFSRKHKFFLSESRNVFHGIPLYRTSENISSICVLNAILGPSGIMKVKFFISV